MTMEEEARSATQRPVFVYGTLRPGENNYAAYLGGRTTKELPASIAGELYFVAEGGYPYVVPGPGRVQGELLEIVPAGYTETLRALDGLEEYDVTNEGKSVYLRRLVRVLLSDGSERIAWTYYWNGPQTVGRKIADGDFKNR